MRSTTIIAPLPGKLKISSGISRSRRAVGLVSSAGIGAAVLVFGVLFLIVGALSYCVRSGISLIRRLFG